jgi:tRNA(adenine34) deaminase
MENADFTFMRQALAEARHGATEGEVPVGALIVMRGEVIAAAHNRPIALGDPTAHAEILAIREAAAKLGLYRLIDASLYVTLEPCAMCVGAMINARVAILKFGTRDSKAGAVGSVYDIGRDGRLNHRIEVHAGLMEAEARALLQEFFRERREE